MRQMGAGGFGGGGPVATKLTIAVGVVSVLAAIAAARIDAGILQALLFTPADVLAGKLWQPVTYAFVSGELAGGGIFFFLLSLYVLWAIGGQVEASLGSKRFLGFFIAAPALGALLTIPVALIGGFAAQPFDGLWVALGAMTVLFARSFSRTPILLFFVLPLMGWQLIAASFGLLLLTGLLSGFPRIFPAFFAMVVALVFSYGGFQPRRAWLRFRAYLIERELKKRSAHLSVIRGGRGEDEEPDAPPKRKDGEGGQGPWLH